MCRRCVQTQVACGCACCQGATHARLSVQAKLPPPVGCHGAVPTCRIECVSECGVHKPPCGLAQRREAHVLRCVLQPLVASMHNTWRFCMAVAVIVAEMCGVYVYSLLIDYYRHRGIAGGLLVKGSERFQRI